MQSAKGQTTSINTEGLDHTCPAWLAVKCNGCTPHLYWLALHCWVRDNGSTFWYSAIQLSIRKMDLCSDDYCILQESNSSSPIGSSLFFLLFEGRGAVGLDFNVDVLKTSLPSRLKRTGCTYLAENSARWFLWTCTVVVKWYSHIDLPPVNRLSYQDPQVTPSRFTTVHDPRSLAWPTTRTESTDRGVTARIWPPGLELSPRCRLSFNHRHTYIDQIPCKALRFWDSV